MRFGVNGEEREKRRTGEGIYEKNRNKRKQEHTNHGDC